MANDPLKTLVKLRKLACDDARRALVSALLLEDRAEQASHRIERTIAEETEVATDIHGSDAAVEAFAAWLPSARRELAQTQLALTDRQADTVRCRAELTACRTALEIVETLVSEREAAKRRATDLLYARDLEDRPRRATGASEEMPG